MRPWRVSFAAWARESISEAVRPSHPMRVPRMSTPSSMAGPSVSRVISDGPAAPFEARLACISRKRRAARRHWKTKAKAAILMESGQCARMAELADALDLGTSGQSSEGAEGQAVPVDPTRVLASCLAFLAENDPDLAVVVKAWPGLSEPIRRAVLALVGTAQ